MNAETLTAADADRLQECVAGGGVAVFPTDTVYGVCCDPDSERAVARLYELKQYPSVDPRARAPARPAAVMFFALERALEALPALRPAEHAALETLLPGPVTLLLPNREARFAPACGPDPLTIGLRVPRLPDTLAALGSMGVPVMQSSANLSGQPDARTLADVPAELLAGADLVLDGGELVGVPSTVIDLRDYSSDGEWRVIREGALPIAALRRLLAS
ncbi:MAG TPA: L-threonylcarbamoyladenylate synthase [Solirubrobacteraceae bacterium]|nr:L-threonylcarbamoyladenylate synthase [Solirubrobacteraceae bacterium]